MSTLLDRFCRYVRVTTQSHETSKTYPSIEKLAGVDISLKMITHARTQTETEQLNEHLEFRTMDALRMLEFPNAYFDLVNQRLGASWLRVWEWTKILLEYQRVTLDTTGHSSSTHMNFHTSITSSPEFRFYQGPVATFVANGIQAVNFLGDRLLRTAPPASSAIAVASAS